MNGYNFTERVRKVLGMAREEAGALKHEYVGTEHILLGILREGQGVASTALQNFNVDPDALRSRILGVVKAGRAQAHGPDLPYTSRAKKVLELAMSEARELNHSYVGTEHLLLGLLGEAKGVGAQVLRSAGVNLEAARTEVLRILGTERPQPSARPRGPDVLRSVGWGSDNAVRKHLPTSTRRLREIIGAAHDVAVERHSLVIAPTHVAIALLRHEGGMANAALERLDFDRTAVLAALNDIAPRGTTPIDPEGTVTPAPEVVLAIEAMEELRHQAGAATAGSHHLLLALLMTSRDIDPAFAGQKVDANMIQESIRWISG